MINRKLIIKYKLIVFLYAAYDLYKTIKCVEVSKIEYLRFRIQMK